MAQHVLDAHLQRGGRAGAAGARPLHVEIDHAVSEILEYDIAAILGHGRTYARIEQLFDLGDDFVVVRCGNGGFAAFGHHRIAGGVMFHDAAQDGRLENLPVQARLFCDGHEVGAEEHPLDAFDREQPLGQGRRRSGIDAGEIHRALFHDHAARQELEGRRVGRLLGLDKQTWSPSSNAWRLGHLASLRLGTGRLRPRSVPRT